MSTITIESVYPCVDYLSRYKSYEILNTKAPTPNVIRFIEDLLTREVITIRQVYPEVTNKLLDIEVSGLRSDLVLLGIAFNCTEVPTVYNAYALAQLSSAVHRAPYPILLVPPASYSLVEKPKPRNYIYMAQD